MNHLEPAGLSAELERTFGGTSAESRVVARQASDLATSGRYNADVGVELTNPVVLEELADAPDGTPADRWNWWIGALEIAFGGYAAFRVDRYPST